MTHPFYRQPLAWLALLLVLTALSACKTAPPVGLSPEQIAVLQREGFTPSEEGWAFDLSGKVLFGSDLDRLNGQSQAIVERVGRALLSVGMGACRWPCRCLGQGGVQPAVVRAPCAERGAGAGGDRYAARRYPDARVGQPPAGGRQPHQRRPYRAGVDRGGRQLKDECAANARRPQSCANTISRVWPISNGAFASVTSRM